jgi:hypothetical protein
MKKYLYILVLGFIILNNSCSDFIEPNLEKKNITLMSPPNNYRTTNMTNTFWWEEVKGATKYRLQIVDSNFNYIGRLVLDSPVTTNEFNYTLTAGTFQWRVRAENSSSNTSYSQPRTLHIDSTPDLSNQTLVLVSPSNNIYTNTLGNTFKWTSMSSATDYRFQLINMSNNNTVADLIVQTDSFNYTLTQGQFKWQVRAQNASSNSPYSSRIINVDTAPPGAPTLNSPVDGSFQTNPVTLSWTRDANAIADSLYIYTDSLFTTTVISNYITNANYNFTGVTAQRYFWRVKSVDNAGNWSGFSALRKFTVQ